MSEIIEYCSASAETVAPSPVERCCHAYFQVIAEPLREPNPDRRDDRGFSSSARLGKAQEAYVQYLPFLTPTTIQDFICCIVHGMILNAINRPDGKLFLYASQIMHSTLPREPRLPAGRPPRIPDILNKTLDEVSRLASTTVNQKINTPPPPCQPQPGQIPSIAAVAEEDTTAPATVNQKINTPLPLPKNHARTTSGAQIAHPTAAFGPSQRLEKDNWKM